MSDAHGVARDQLRAFIERIERLSEEKKTIEDDIKDVKIEAKSMGFSVKAINEILKLRKLDDHQRNEEELVLDTYKAALGMIPDFSADDEQPETATQSTAARIGRAGPEAVDTVSSGKGSLRREPIGLESPNDGTVSGRTTASEYQASPVDTPIAPASQGEAEVPSVESVSPETHGSSDANTGGEDVTAPYAATHQAGGLVKAPPAAHPVLAIRPFCQHPGEEVCGGSGRTHCRACAAAMREEEVA